MRSRSYDRLMTASLRLLLVFTCFKNSHYIRGFTTQFCMFNYWKQAQHPVLQMVEEFTDNLIEEDGELSLGLLARAAVIHGIQRDRAYLAKLYKLMHLYRKCTADIDNDLSLIRSRGLRHTVSLNDPEVAALKIHFNSVIFRLTHATWRHYPHVPRKGGLYDTKAMMATRLVTNSVPRCRIASFRQEARKALQKVHRLLITGNRSIWQQVQPAPRPVNPPLPTVGRL